MDKRKRLRYGGAVMIEAALAAAGVPWQPLLAVGLLLLVWAECDRPSVRDRIGVLGRPLWGGRTPAPPPTGPAHKEAEAPKPPGQHRILSPRTAWELMTLCEGKTDAQAAASIAPHLGSSIEVEGEVRNVRVDEFYVTVEIGIGPRMQFVDLTFERAWEARLTIADAGDWMRAVGRVKAVWPISMILESCELLELRRSN